MEENEFELPNAKYTGKHTCKHFKPLNQVLLFFLRSNTTHKKGGVHKFVKTQDILSTTKSSGFLHQTSAYSVTARLVRIQEK